jgi:hypothetical protein
VTSDAQLRWPLAHDPRASPPRGGCLSINLSSTATVIDLFGAVDPRGYVVVTVCRTVNDHCGRMEPWDARSALSEFPGKGSGDRWWGEHSFPQG